MYLLKEWVYIKQFNKNGEIVSYKEMLGKVRYSVKIDDVIYKFWEHELAPLK